MGLPGLPWPQLNLILTMAMVMALVIVVITVTLSVMDMDTMVEKGEVLMNPKPNLNLDHPLLLKLIPLLRPTQKLIPIITVTVTVTVMDGTERGVLMLILSLITMVMVLDIMAMVDIHTTEATTDIIWASVLPTLKLNHGTMVTDMGIPTVMVVMAVTTGAKLTDQNLLFLSNP